MQNLIYLARQGLLMRRNWMSIEGGTSCEEHSNFHQLMLLRANDDVTILNIMTQKTRKYTDHHIQNEMLQIVALKHLRTIGNKIRDSGYFVLELTDASNKEQVIVCLRWIDTYLEPHEEFIGLHVVDDITTVHYCDAPNES